jgi:Flp pilus assembly protein TadG
MRKRSQRGSASVWAIVVIAGAFTVLLGLVVDGGGALDARVAASRAAAQAARAGADALSPASVRDGYAAEIDVGAAKARARDYLHNAGMTGTVYVAGRTVTVTVSGRSSTKILSVIGIASFPIKETESAQAITEGDSP